MRKLLTIIMLCLFTVIGAQAQEEPSEGAPLEDTSTLRHFTVHTAAEFLAALGSDRVVTLAPGAVLNLSKALQNRTVVEDNGCQWRDDFYQEREMVKCELFVSSDVYDGRQLELVNVSNLTIRGSKDCYIIVEPRYANVLSLYGCRFVRIENLTLGHTYDGECAGGVIECQNCEGTVISHCDLYGCGITGLAAHDCHGIVMENTIIRDCSEGIMELHDSRYCSFLDCDFIRCTDYSGVYIDEGCKSTRFVRCRFAENGGTLFSIHSNVRFESCEIHHAKGQSLGNVADGYIQYVDDNTRWFRDGESLSPRDVGPQ